MVNCSIPQCANKANVTLEWVSGGNTAIPILERDPVCFDHFVAVKGYDLRPCTCGHFQKSHGIAIAMNCSECGCGFYRHA